jgi:hypothetical protein
MMNLHSRATGTPAFEYIVQESRGWLILQMAHVQEQSDEVNCVLVAQTPFLLQ